MKTKCEADRPLLTTVCWVLAFLFSTTLCYPNQTSPADPCEAPTNLSVDSHSLKAVSFSWDNEGGCNTYELWYVRESDGFVSSTIITSNRSIRFSNLSAGAYTFYLRKTCGTGSSTAIVVDDLMMG